MARHSDNSWMWMLAGLGVLVYASQQAISGGNPAAPGIPYYSGTPTPLSIYPEYSYTVQTSMAATPAQKVPAAVVPPMPYFTSVQEQEQAALLSQCAGSYQCSAMLGDTQLGF